MGGTASAALKGARESVSQQVRVHVCWLMCGHIQYLSLSGCQTSGWNVRDRHTGKLSAETVPAYLMIAFRLQYEVLAAGFGFLLSHACHHCSACRTP